MKKIDIITFCKSLQGRMQDELSGEDPEDMTAAGKALTMIRTVVSELNSFAISYTFSTQEEEIRFFKEEKPVIMSQYFYYKKKFSVLLSDSFSTVQKRKENYKKELRKMQRLADANKEFYRYCLSGDNRMDKQFFTLRHTLFRDADNGQGFSTGYDIVLSKLLAHELLKKFIHQCVSRMENRNDLSSVTLNWTDSKVALIELIYALHVSGTINNNKADIKQLVTAFQYLFSIDLGNYARVFAEIRIRKNGQTTFLDRIRENLVQRINDFDR